MALFGRRLVARLLGDASRVALILGIGVGAAHADTSWTGAASLDWFDPANWSNGVPDETVSAVIDPGTAVPVLFEMNGAATAGNLTLGVDAGDANNIVFGGTAGSALQVGLASPGTLMVGDKGAAILTLESGYAVESGYVVLGNASGSSGAIVLGVGASLTAGQIVVGANGMGYIGAGADSSIKAESTVVGSVAGSYGQIELTNAGAYLESTDLVVGYSGGGLLEISSGAKATGDELAIGARAGSSGVVNLQDDGSALNFTNLMVGGAGTGELNVSQGAVVNSYGIFVGNSASSTSSTGQGTVNVMGGQLNAQYTLAIGGYSQGQVVVSEGGVISAGEVWVVAADGVVAELTLMSGAVLKTKHLVGGAEDGDGNLMFANGTVRFDDATLQLTADEAEIFQAFDTGDVTIDEGGAVFDTQGFSVGTALGLVGDGALTKLGSGTLTLSGSSALGGGLIVEEGAVNLLGSLDGDADVVAGTLGGTGSLGKVTVGSAGTLAAGDLGQAGAGIGTLSMDELGLEAGATLAVELNDGGNESGVNTDLVVVKGTIDIAAGARIYVTAENGTDDGSTYVAGTSYVILTTDTPDGLYIGGSLLVEDDFAYLNFVVSQDGQNLLLTSELAATSFCFDGATANECAVGDAAFALGKGSDVFGALLGLSDSEAAAALDSISGEVHAAVARQVAQDFLQFGDALAARVGGDFTASASDVAAAAAKAEGQGTWIAGYGSMGTLDGDGNSASVSTSGGGLRGGYEWRAGDFVGGLAGSYGRTSLSLDTRDSTAAIEAANLGLYGGLANAGGSLSMALTAGAARIESERGISVGKIDAEADAAYSAGSVGLATRAMGNLELADGLVLSPVATAALGLTSRDGFVETGAGAFDLEADASTTLSARAGIGLALAQQFHLEWGHVTLSADLGWQRATSNDRDAVDLAFVDGASSFSVSAASAPANSLSASAGLTIAGIDGWAVAMRYAASLSGSSVTSEGSLSVTGRF